jgi:hypothetical protein
LSKFWRNLVSYSKSLENFMCSWWLGANEGIGLALSVEGCAKFLGMPTKFRRRKTPMSE